MWVCRCLFLPLSSILSCFGTSVLRSERLHHFTFPPALCEVPRPTLVISRFSACCFKQAWSGLRTFYPFPRIHTTALHARKNYTPFLQVRKQRTREAGYSSKMTQMVSRGDRIQARVSDPTTRVARSVVWRPQGPDRGPERPGCQGTSPLPVPGSRYAPRMSVGAPWTGPTPAGAAAYLLHVGPVCDGCPGDGIL